MKTWLSIVIVTAMAIVTSADVLACGDKFFVPGRGAHFVPTPEERGKATVLFYAPSSSALSATMTRLKAEAALGKAGYKLTIATKPEDLKSAAPRAWDIVIAAADDGELVKQQVSQSQAHIVAVVEKGSSTQLAVARKNFAAAMWTPSRNQDFLDVLDEAASRAFDEFVKAKGR